MKDDKNWPLVLKEEAEVDFDICVFHANCADGFGAACVVKNQFPDSKMIFHPGHHGEKPPSAKGKRVLIVDFSYKRDRLIELAAESKSVLILDHHKSAEADLVDLPKNVTVVFDMTKSGALLTWDYFNPKEEAPILIQYISDRDIWEFKLPNSAEVAAALFSYEYEFDIWMDFIFKGGQGKVDELMKDGQILVKKQTKDIHELIKKAGHKLTVNGTEVPALNCPYFFSSEAGNIMAQNEPFAVCYMLTGSTIQFSVRSTDEGEDGSLVAALYGGGGHRNASGFQLPLTPDWKDVLAAEVKSK